MTGLFFLHHHYWSPSVVTNERKEEDCFFTETEVRKHTRQQTPTNKKYCSVSGRKVKRSKGHFLFCYYFSVAGREGVSY